MDVLLQVLSYLGGTVALVGAIAFLSKQWVLHRLDRDLETFRAQLQLEHERQVQSLRYEFERAALEHQVKFQQVFPQRHQGLVEIHRIVRAAVEACHLALRSDGDPHVPAAINATDAMQKAIYTHEIYLPKVLCEKWRKTGGNMFSALVELRDARAQQTSNWVEDRRRLASAATGYIDTLNAMTGDIADDIREAIGVEVAKTKSAEPAFISNAGSLSSSGDSIASATPSTPAPRG